MRKTVHGLKWLSVSITVASLVMVFWVWPAWNAGSQKWYWGNDASSINTMYRNFLPPSGHNAPFQFKGNFGAPSMAMVSFIANEAANQMLTFGPDPWQYQIEWYLTPMMMNPMAVAVMEMVSFDLTIGRWSGMGMMMMYAPFFSAMGSGGPGSMVRPFAAMGSALPMTGMMGSLAFMTGDMLGAMATFTIPANFDLNLHLASSCFITSPLSDPGYPGYPGAAMIVPTLSQWGTLVLAILLPLFYPFVIRGRFRMGRS